MTTKSLYSTLAQRIRQQPTANEYKRLDEVAFNRMYAIDPDFVEKL